MKTSVRSGKQKPLPSAKSLRSNASAKPLLFSKREYIVSMSAQGSTTSSVQTGDASYSDYGPDD